MAALSLLNAAGFVNLMGSVSTLSDITNRLLPRGEADQGFGSVAVPPADAPNSTPEREPKRDPNSGLPQGVVDVFDKIYKAAGMGGVKTKQEQIETEDKAEANQARVKLSRNWFAEQIEGFGLRALFIFGGAFLTGLGVIFILREARPNETADFGDKLADALTKEK